MEKGTIIGESKNRVSVMWVIDFRSNASSDAALVIRISNDSNDSPNQSIF